MDNFLSGSSFFYVMLTLTAFGIGSICQKKGKLAILNPLLIASCLVILILQLFEIPNEAYQAGCQVLNWLITPATICLSISFYQQFQQLKKELGAICIGVVAGTVCSLGGVYLLSMAFGLDQAITVSLLPKSVTTAIGSALSQELGGIVAITTTVIAVTGVLGSVLGPILCKLLKLTDPVAQGVAFGTASHVIGTTRALALSQLAGAVSSFSLTFAGLVTAVLLSILSQFI